MRYLITAQEVINLGAAGKKLDPLKLSPNIPTAEYQWVQKFLGDAFYYELVTQKNGSGLSADNLVLWNQVLGSYVANAVLFLSLDDIQWDIASQGIMLNNTEFSQSDRNAYANLQKPKHSKLLIMQEMVDDFLRRNSAKYPKYSGNVATCGTGKKVDVFSNFGVNLDESDVRSCCDEKPKVEFFPTETPAAVTCSYGVECPDGTEIRLKQVMKNGVLLFSGDAAYETPAALLTYLQTLDATWVIDGANVKISSVNEWKLIVCCCS